jgi:hypothetical protein
MCVPPCQSHYCDCLPSSSVTRLHRYYAIIRIPVLRLPSLLVIACPAYSLPCKAKQGLPGCRLSSISNMPCSQTPGRLVQLAILSLHTLLASELAIPSPYPILSISRLNHFSLRLRPVGSFPLCLIFGITPADPGFTSRRVANLYRSGTLTHQNKRPCPAALQVAHHDSLCCFCSCRVARLAEMIRMLTC